MIGRSRFPSSPRENLFEASPPGNDSSDQKGDLGIATHSPIDDLLSTMTQGDLNHLRKTYSFPTGVQARTILSTHPGEVAFYEDAFPARLRFPDHPTIRRILSFYNICLAQISPNAWKFVVCVLVIWRFYRCHMYLNEFKCKRCNKLPLLTDTEEARTRRVLKRIGLGRYFNIPDVLDSRTFHRFFVPGRGEMSSSGGDKDTSRDGAVAVLGDEGESLRLRDESPQNESPRDESVEYLGIIKKEWRILPPFPDLTMLLAKWVDDKKSKEGSKVATSSNTGVVIREKQPRDEVQDLVADDSKGKELAPPPETKKAKSSKAASKGVMPPVAPSKGESSKKPPPKGPGEVLGEDASVYANHSMAEKFFYGVILPADKEKVDKLSLDQVVTKYFHVLGQGIVLGPSLAIQCRDLGNDASLQLAKVESSNLEMVRAQNRALELEGLQAQSFEEAKRTSLELQKRNEDVTRLEAEVAEL
ncbi:spermidine synthase [Actinidia rufa]|uniref:Spermidine synthase n=1 Tax=Actinidia rufa TaxID=165716 RepID=A0A7J0EMZ3_9ERIC|nr:spermidine synthase [Actinidia rufa]